jgi:hypothetical protein
MTVRWVFSRGDQRTSIDVIRFPQTCTICVHEPNGGEQEITFPTLIDAMLGQAALERELTRRGWELADFQRLPT